jgi:hypothetical protein
LFVCLLFNSSSFKQEHVIQAASCCQASISIMLLYNSYSFKCHCSLTAQIRTAATERNSLSIKQYFLLHVVIDMCHSGPDHVRDGSQSPKHRCHHWQKAPLIEVRLPKSEEFMHHYATAVVRQPTAWRLRKVTCQLYATCLHWAVHP